MDYHRVKVSYEVMKGSGWILKDVPSDMSLEDFFKSIKSSIEEGIDVPQHRKLVKSLYLFDKPKTEGVQPLTMSKTFKEAFGSRAMFTKHNPESSDKPAKRKRKSDAKAETLELYTDYFDPKSSERAARRECKD